MKQSEIFEQAAEYIESPYSNHFGELYACEAITSTRGDTRREMSLFAKYFKPRTLSRSESWFGCSSVDEHQLARVLALLFCAEIAKEKR